VKQVDRLVPQADDIGPAAMRSGERDPPERFNPFNDGETIRVIRVICGCLVSALSCKLVKSCLVFFARYCEKLCSSCYPPNK
jgi:hypothetical protein